MSNAQQRYRRRSAAQAAGVRNWGYSYFMLGQVKAAAGDREAAIGHIERASELEPANNRYKRTLEQIRRD